MSEPSNPSGKNTAPESVSTRTDTNVLKMEVGEIQEILRGLKKKGVIVNVVAEGDILVIALQTPGHAWTLKETGEGKKTLQVDEEAVNQ